MGTEIQTGRRRRHRRMKVFQVLIASVWSLVACLGAQVEAFVAPPSGVHGACGAKRAWGSGAKPLASAADYTQSASAAQIVADKTRNMRHQMRDAIWKATDSIVKAVEDMPEAKDNKTLEKLGEWVEEIDEKYFGKYRGVGATNSYLESISTPQVEQKSMATRTSSEADGGKDGNSKGPVAVVADAGAKMKQDTSEAVEKAAKSTSGTGSESSGTIQLDRPKKVQGVFDELQRQAVAYYRQSPAGARSDSKSGSSVALTGGMSTPLPEAIQKLESELEVLLTSANYQPRSLAKDKRAQLVTALKGMEDGYPDEASPLGDPALPGEWSLVYSSSGNLINRALKGLFARLVKLSEPRQTITPQSSSVTNACRARLRLTPLSWRVSQTGRYRISSAGGEKSSRKIEVEYPEQKQGWLRRLVPRLRSGKVQTEVTYLSTRWRICRSAMGDVTVAFRKVQP